MVERWVCDRSLLHNVVFFVSDAGAAWWSSIDCGGHHSLALTRDGNLFSWGWGVYGQLAHDGINDLDRPRKVASNVRGLYICR